MKTINTKKIAYTNDVMIRDALKKTLETRHANDKKVRIIEELGVQNGNARIDIAVVNGIMDGYEIKSDLDTLQRLPEQIRIYNSVFNKITLVVGKKHLQEAIKLVPDWWGITVAKITSDNSVGFNIIRAPEFNKNQDSVSIARLLWKEEALKILEEIGEIKGFRSKNRDSIYKKLSDTFDKETLSSKVRETIFFREGWRLDAPLMINGD